MNDFHNLLSPLQIGPIQVRNRVLVSAHVPGFAEDNKPGEKYINYHRRYASEGVGLQITGGTPVHTSGMLGLSSDALWNLDDAIIPGYQRLGEAVHEEEGRILAQLAHSAGTVLIDEPGKESWSASPIQSRTSGNISHEMSLSEIQEVVEAYAAAASRVANAELDGVEVLSAFGFLPQAFLSPLSNWREDAYGGSLENRMRFLVEVLEAVRAELDPAQILGLRLPGDEFEPGGLDLEQMKVISRIIAEAGLADYLSITAHTNFTHNGRSKHWAPTPTPHGVFVELAAAIRDQVNIPVFAVGRIIDPRHAEAILAAGKADMVGMTRAHICDPQIVSKIKRNALKQIRPCVGANTCIARRYEGKTIRCMHNPMLASPAVQVSRTTNIRKIAVIGAGPAGLEAARITAERGHTVTVYESDNHAGGQLALWARSISMAELGKIIDWRLNEFDRLGVELKLQHEIKSHQIANLGADVIIVATGARDYLRKYPGADHVSHTTPHRLLRGEPVVAKRAMVCSDGRGHAGLVSAELLLHQGISVELITSDYAVAADLDSTHRNAWYERLGKLGAVLTPRVILDQVHNDKLILNDVFTGQRSVREAVDLIVYWNGCRVNDELLSARPARNGRPEWHAAGDCIAPRNVEVAMAEAARVANVV